VKVPDEKHTVVSMLWVAGEEAVSSVWDDFEPDMVGPYCTEEGVYSGVNDYGLQRLQFGLDGSYQDDYFYPSSLQWPDEVHQYEPVMRVVADKREDYEA
jgi:hypothetical protein